MENLISNNKLTSNPNHPSDIDSGIANKKKAPTLSYRCLFLSTKNSYSCLQTVSQALLHSVSQVEPNKKIANSQSLIRVSTNSLCNPSPLIASI